MVNSERQFTNRQQATLNLRKWLLVFRERLPPTMNCAYAIPTLRTCNVTRETRDVIYETTFMKMYRT